MNAYEEVARGAVEEAGQILRTAWAEGKQFDRKGAVDLVTDTDRQVEDLVVRHLQKAFPSHLIVAEEASAVRGAQKPPEDAAVWYLDPLDGTINFVSSVPHFCISLAFARGTTMQFAIVHDPMRNETFTAHRRGGAYLNGKSIAVSATHALEDALIATGLPYDRRARAEYYLGFSIDFVRRCRDLRRFGSAALDLCYVACGRFDGFWEWRLKPWDTAAGSLIVQEAGGMVTDFLGLPFELFGDQILASNGRIHAPMCTLLRRRMNI